MRKLLFPLSFVMKPDRIDEEKQNHYFQRIANCYPGSENEALKIMKTYADRDTARVLNWEKTAEKHEQMFKRREERKETLRGPVPDSELSHPLYILMDNLEAELYDPLPSEPFSSDFGSRTQPLPRLDDLDSHIDPDAYWNGAYDGVARLCRGSNGWFGRTVEIGKLTPYHQLGGDKQN